MTTAISLRRWRTRAGLWLALAAMLLQTVLPPVHYAAGFGLDRAAFAVAHSLCLAPGTPPPADPHKAPAHKPPCSICQTFQLLAGGFVPPAVIVLRKPIAGRSVDYLALGCIDLPPRRSGGLGARAPPPSI